MIITSPINEQMVEAIISYCMISTPKALKNQIFVIHKIRNCLRMDLREVYTPKIWVFSPWPSGLRRQTISDHLGKKWGGALGWIFFFFSFFYIFAWPSILANWMLYWNLEKSGLEILPEITKMWITSYSANWEIG